MRYKMGELSKLPNIGKVVEKQLNEVGINTVDDLINIGSKEAWLKIKKIDESACINRLMALEGAIQNIRWHNLSDDDKENLKEFYNSKKRH
ncbi:MULTISPECIES: TfoX/Sxy family protein [Methanobrevibacter]|uniref:TfoX/Sxy family protein n=2 Tax=Methanobrevibacter TaxID=2172 RepID=UPI0026F07184|nr:MULTISPECIES: TfoX/Sxy family protein [Methanobrevibacter]